MKALLIPVDGPPREVHLPGGRSTGFLRSLRNPIGADGAERIGITTRWEAWLDEDAITAGKPVNQAATRLAHSFGWQFRFRGDIIIVGLNEDASAAATLSPDQVDAILKMTGHAP